MVLLLLWYFVLNLDNYASHLGEKSLYFKQQHLLQLQYNFYLAY